jgi:starvation-inducible DNA-binding protein
MPTVQLQRVITAPVEHASDVSHELQGALVGMIELALLTKQAHWNIHGPAFGSIHLMLDAHAAQYRLWADQLAERMLALGTAPDGRASTVASDGGQPEMPDGPLADQAVVEWFAEALNQYAARLRGHMEAVATNDAITEDMLIGIITEIEKYQWMLRSHASNGR